MRSNKILYTVLIVIGVLFLITFLQIILQRHEVYKKSVQMVETNENIIALLGEPIKTSLLCSGSLKNMKYAKYKIYFHGPDGKGSLSVVANKRQGQWILDKATFKSQDKEINLLESQ